MIRLSGFPTAVQYARVSLAAVSIASPPPDVKKTLASPSDARPATRAASFSVDGAGYTGLWTALTLKRREPSLRVIVFEAEHVGHGPSGRNGGFCHGLWASLRFLRDAVGPEGALAVARASSGVQDAVSGLGEDVWAR